MGSINADLTCVCSRLPGPGETVLGADVQRLPGGKGANQAVAAARLGARVKMVGAVGDDDSGRDLVEVLRSECVDVAGVRTVCAPTGMALVLVDTSGENQIVVSPGANAEVVVGAEDLAGAAAVLAQLEISLATVERAAAKTSGMFCLNAAPAREIPAALIGRCDLIIVNDGEREAVPGLDRAALVAVTHGARGATLLQCGRVVAQASSPRVQAVDSVGAGDAFAAALTVLLAQGRDPSEALTFACAAGALATMRHGAQAALPRYEEVLACVR